MFCYDSLFNDGFERSSYKERIIMNLGIIILIIIFLLFIIGTSCLIIDCFMKKTIIYNKKPKPKTNPSYDYNVNNNFEYDDLIIKD